MIYFYLLILILLWTINPFIKKKILGNLSSEDYFFINHIIVTVFVIIYFFYKKMLKKNEISENNLIQKTLNLSKKDKFFIIIGGIVTLISARLLPFIISLKYDISRIISNVQPLIIILSAILGYIFFDEKINKKRCLGIFIICLGLLVFNL